MICVAEKNNIPIMKLLISYGANISFQKEKLLFDACYNGSLDMV